MDGVCGWCVWLVCVFIFIYNVSIDMRARDVRESINIIGNTARIRITKGDPIMQHHISGYIE